MEAFLFYGLEMNKTCFANLYFIAGILIKNHFQNKESIKQDR